jgi:hypothetical protein
MAMTNKEKQTAFRTRKYAEGWKLLQVWIEGKPEHKIDRYQFLDSLDAALEKLSVMRRSALLHELEAVIEQFMLREDKKAGKKPAKEVSDEEPSEESSEADS